MFLIVDGYNIIGAWPEFRGDVDLSQSRDKLIHTLADYAGYEKCRLVLVFDGYRAGKKSLNVEQINGITVVYTRQHETADHFIERTVDEYLEGVPKYAHADVRVATNDGLEQSVVLSRGAVRMTASELRAQIFSVRARHRQNSGNKGYTAARAGDGAALSTGAPLEDRLTEQQKSMLERMRRGNDESL